MTHDTELAARLARLEDLEAIRTLKHRYLQAADSKDMETFRASFVEDAVCDYGPLGRFEGREALVEMFASVALKKTDDGAYAVWDMHHAGHPVITVDGDEATGTWSLRFRQVDTVNRSETVSGIAYDDTYRRVDGEWRIATSAIRMLWGMVRPLPEDTLVMGGIE